MLAVVIAFVCFYHAKCMLSAIATFLVHLLGEGVGQDEMGELEESVEGRRRVWQCTKE